MNYFYHIAVVITVYTVLALSLDLVVGQCGRLSLCHAAFYGIGAFASSILMVRMGWDYLPATVVAVAVTAATATAIGLLALRLREEFFVLATLAFQLIIGSILYNWIDVTGGPYGLPGIPRPTFLGTRLDSPALFLVFSLTVAVVVVVLYWQLTRSPYGRVLRAIRDDHLAVTVLGKNVYLIEVGAFVISAGLAAVAGTVWATWAAYIDPTSFGVDEAIFLLAVVVIGGLGSVWGPVLGASFMVLLPEVLRLGGTPDAYAPNVQQLVYGMILVLLMRFRRQGIYGGYALE